MHMSYLPTFSTISDHCSSGVPWALNADGWDPPPITVGDRGVAYHVDSSGYQICSSSGGLLRCRDKEGKDGKKKKKGKDGEEDGSNDGSNDADGEDEDVEDEVCIRLFSDIRGFLYLSSGLCLQQVT